MFHSETTPTSTAKRRVSPADIRELERRAAAFADIGGVSLTERARNQARYAYELSLDYHRYGVLGRDFPRWLAEHSGLSLTTCWRRYKQGRRLAGRAEQANASRLLAEQRAAETTPRPDLELDF